MKVDQNLQLVQIRTEEIRQEYSRLEKDRQDALRWREITDQLTQIERDLAFAELARVENRLNALKEEASAYTTNITEFENQRQHAKERKEALVQSVQTGQTQIKTLDEQLHQKEIEATRLREILKGLKLTSEKISRQTETLGASVDHLKTQETEEKSAYSELEEEIARLKTEEQSHREKIEPI